MYSCNYELLDEDRVILKSKYSNACFSDIWHNFKCYPYIRYIIPYDFEVLTGADTYNIVKCSVEQIKEYVNILRKLGVPIEEDYSYSISYKDKKIDCMSFTIPTDHELLGKVILCMLRYIHENPVNFSMLIPNLIEINKLKGLHIINKVIMSHYYNSSFAHYGHSVLSTYYRPKYISKSQYVELISKTKNRCEMQSNFTNLSMLTHLDRNKLKEYSEKGINEFYKYYKTLL